MNCDGFEMDSHGQACVKCRTPRELHQQGNVTTDSESTTKFDLVRELIMASHAVINDESIIKTFRIHGNKSLNELDKILEKIGIYDEF